MLIQVKVKTKQKISKLIINEDGEYIAYLKSLPTKNNANIELIDLISEHFAVIKSEVKIKIGKYSTNKVIYIGEQMSL